MGLRGECFLGFMPLHPWWPDSTLYLWQNLCGEAYSAPFLVVFEYTCFRIPFCCSLWGRGVSPLSFIEYQCVFTSAPKMTGFAAPPPVPLGFCSIREDKSRNVGFRTFPSVMADLLHVYTTVGGSFYSPILSPNLSREQRDKVHGKDTMSICSFHLGLGLPEILFCHTSPYLTSKIYLFLLDLFLSSLW